MCRICGRMIKCIFDSMPSKVGSNTIFRREFSSSTSTRICSTVPPRSLPLRSRTNQGSLPVRSHQKVHLHQATIQQTASPISQFQNTSSEIPPLTSIASSDPIGTSSTTNETSTTSTDQPTSPSPSKPLVLSKSLQQLLPSLQAQKQVYITAHIHRFPYLLTEGDTVRLPFHMHGVSSGDILRLNRASIIGSRDYTLKAGTNSQIPSPLSTTPLSTESKIIKRTNESPYLDERLFECRARVIGVESQPMTTKEKTKRRNRKVKTVKSKHKYTILKVMQVRLKDLDELKREDGLVLLE